MFFKLHQFKKAYGNGLLTKVSIPHENQYYLALYGYAYTLVTRKTLVFTHLPVYWDSITTVLFSVLKT